MSSPISVIILAAGKSTRMGKQKLRMPLGQHSMLEHTVDNYLNSEVNEVLVVVGHEADEIKQLLAHKPVTIVYNPRYNDGIGTSISAGVQHMKETTQLIIIALADQPYIRSDIINYLVYIHRDSNKGITIPVYKGTRGNPVIFSSTYRKELIELQGDTGGRQVTDRHPDDVLEVDIEFEEVTIDIDTMDSYYKAIDRHTL
jgi:molybdenum cofactor cytidylyltransferase